MLIMRYVWKYPLWKVVPFGLFLIVDFAFLTSTYVKIPQGGYVAIINALVFMIPMLVWFLGEQKLKYWRRAHDTTSPMESLAARFVAITNAGSSEMSKGKSPVPPPPQTDEDPTPAEDKTILYTTPKSSSSSHEEVEIPQSPTQDKDHKDKKDHIKNPLYINMQPSVNKLINFLPHVGVFLCTSKTRTPSIFEDFITRVSGIPATVIFLKPTKTSIPVVATNKTLEVKKISDNIFLVSLYFGYTEHMTEDTIENVLKRTSSLGIPDIDINDVTIYASAEMVRIIHPNWLWDVVLYMYALMKRLFFGIYVIELPPKETIYLTSVATL